MPLQNRVDPWSRLVAVEGRGTLMGNRGCLHDDARRIVRHHLPGYRRWILCRLEFKGRKRAVMTPKRYTELFFLDEATGLAAGHRPCFECQRARFRAFVDAWARGNPSSLSSRSVTDTIDAILDKERIEGRDHKLVHAADFGDLSGAIVLLDRDDEAYLIQGDRLFPWSFSGYGAPVSKPASGAVRLLTPPSIVNALRAGYVADVHPSAATR